MSFTVTDACTACGACLLSCPERCIRVADREHHAPLVVLADACTDCGECAEVCPAEAIVPEDEAPLPEAEALLPLARPEEPR